MGLLQLIPVELGEVGVLPRTIKMLTTDNLATITTAGYLNGVNNQLPQVAISATDVIECIYDYDTFSGTGLYVTLVVGVSGGIITLSAAVDLNALLDDHIWIGNGSNVPTPKVLSGDVTLANTGVVTIANSAITNVKISASAAIAFSKLASLATGHVLVGNGGVVTDVALSGDATIGATGVLTIANNAITTVKILNANVTLAKLAAGITPSHIVKFAAQYTTVGGAAAEAITVTGALNTDLAYVQVVSQGSNTVSVLKAVVTADTLTVTFSGDPGNDAIVNYQLLRAAS